MIAEFGLPSLCQLLLLEHIKHPLNTSSSLHFPPLHTHTHTHTQSCTHEVAHRRDSVARVAQRTVSAIRRPVPSREEVRVKGVYSSCLSCRRVSFVVTFLHDSKIFIAVRSNTAVLLLLSPTRRTKIHSSKAQGVRAVRR
jgi:hypothetical protein